MRLADREVLRFGVLYEAMKTHARSGCGRNGGLPLDFVAQRLRRGRVFDGAGPYGPASVTVT